MYVCMYVMKISIIYYVHCYVPCLQAIQFFDNYQVFFLEWIYVLNDDWISTEYTIAKLS